MQLAEEVSAIIAVDCSLGSPFVWSDAGLIELIYRCPDSGSWSRRLPCAEGFGHQQVDELAVLAPIGCQADLQHVAAGVDGWVSGCGPGLVPKAVTRISARQAADPAVIRWPRSSPPRGPLAAIAHRLSLWFHFHDSPMRWKTAIRFRRSFLISSASWRRVVSASRSRSESSSRLSFSQVWYARLSDWHRTQGGPFQSGCSVQVLGGGSSGMDAPVPCLRSPCRSPCRGVFGQLSRRF